MEYVMLAYAEDRLGRLRAEAAEERLARAASGGAGRLRRSIRDLFAPRETAARSTPTTNPVCCTA